MRKTLLLFLLFPTFSYANVIISATREVYPSDRKEISVQLLNDGSSPSLVQAWIDDGDPASTPETAKVPFLLMPPVVKVPVHSGQQLTVKYLGGVQPKDHESVFYLNVLDIPPVPEDLTGKSVMQLAIRSRIKLFFRPVALKSSPANRVKNITLSSHGNALVIHNSSPYYFTISGIRSLPHGKNILPSGMMIAPFSQSALNITNPLPDGSTLSVIYINDYGASIETKKQIQK